MQSFYKKEQKGRYNVYIPLFLLSAANLMLYGIRLSLWGAVWMAAYAFVEEALYRGFLLSALTRRYEERLLRGIMFSSLLFALMHTVNVYKSATPLYVAVQSLCAGTVGFCLGIVACRERSIVLCVLLHACVNIASLGAGEPGTFGRMPGKLDVTSREAAVFIASAVLYALYGIWLYRRGILLKREEKSYEALH